jgi:hypothetical protein
MPILYRRLSAGGLSKLYFAGPDLAVTGQIMNSSGPGDFIDKSEY